MNQRIHCPNPVCPQPDDVQKVSLIVASGTRQQAVTPYYSVTTMNALSEQLAEGAPARPENKGKWGSGSVVTMLVLGFFLFFGVLALVEVILYTFGLLPGRVKSAVELFYLSPLIFGVVPAIIMVALVRYKRAAAAKFKTDFAEWSRKQARWESLYYCNRCGSVFNPTEGDRFVPASRMKELLV